MIEETTDNLELVVGEELIVYSGFMFLQYFYVVSYRRLLSYATNISPKTCQLAISFTFVESGLTGSYHKTAPHLVGATRLFAGIKSSSAILR